MALEALACKGAGPNDPRISHGLAGDVKGISSTIEVGVGANVNSTYDFGYVPSNARLLGISRCSFDKLSSAATLLDLGLAPVDGNVGTGSQNCLASGIDVFTAAGSGAVIADPASWGKRAWEFFTTTDPGGSLLVRGTLRGGAALTGGTLSVEVLFIVP